MLTRIPVTLNGLWVSGQSQPLHVNNLWGNHTMEENRRNGRTRLNYEYALFPLIKVFLFYTYVLSYNLGFTGLLDLTVLNKLQLYTVRLYWDWCQMKCLCTRTRMQQGFDLTWPYLSADVALFERTRRLHSDAGLGRA